MTSRRSRGAVIAVALGMIWSATACSAQDDSGTGGPSEPSAQEPAGGASGNLVIGNWQWLEPGRGELLWAAAEGYSDVNPDVTLEQSAVAFGDYADKIRTEIGGGGGPDVLMMTDSLFAELADAGLLLPLDDAIGDRESALNVTNDDSIVDGQRLGLTWERVNYAFFWNQELVDQAGVEIPTDVDSLIAAGQEVQEVTGATGFAVRHQIAELSGWSLDYANWPFGHGASFSEDGSLTLDTPEHIAAAEAFKRVYDSGIMPIGDDASTFRTKFAEGEVAFMIDNSGALLSMVTNNEIVPGTSVGAGPQPFPYPASHQQLMIGVNANSQNVDAAMDFITWFVTPEAQAAFQVPLGASTLATDVELTNDFVDSNPWAVAFRGLASQSRAALIPGFEVQTPEIQKIYLTHLESSLTGGVDVTSALEAAQREAEQAVG